MLNWGQVCDKRIYVFYIKKIILNFKNSTISVLQSYVFSRLKTSWHVSEWIEHFIVTQNVDHSKALHFDLNNSKYLVMFSLRNKVYFKEHEIYERYCSIDFWFSCHIWISRGLPPPSIPLRGPFILTVPVERQDGGGWEIGKLGGGDLISTVAIYQFS